MSCTLYLKCLIFNSLFNSSTCFFTLVYVATTYIKRRDLWADFESIHSSVDGSWIVIGDFNAVIGAHEKRGGRLPCRTSCDEFKSMTDACEFTHIDTKGSLFTWVGVYAILIG